ncbi:MAG: YtxH domain-containing protein [Clostridiaceae bacterium]
MIYLNYVIRIIVGALIGFGYYKLIGCKGGKCAITSSPYRSMLYGIVVAVLLGPQIP